MSNEIRVLQFSQSYFNFDRCVGMSSAAAGAAVEAFYAEPLPAWVTLSNAESFRASRRAAVQWRLVSEHDSCPWGYGWLRVDGDRMVRYQSHWDST